MEWSFSNDMPIYAQLVTQIKRTIAAGVLKPEDRLPTVRDLAIEAGVNPNTVQRAYAELERAGLVYSQRSAGRFVTGEAAVIEKMRSEIAGGETAEYVKNMSQLGFSREEIAGIVQRFMEEEF